MFENKARAELVRHSEKLWTRGWVANHDGNLSVRVAPQRFVCTPTGTSKADVSDGSLLVTDAAGRILSGRKKPFGEYPMHLAIYRARSDVGAVVHAHPPYATALGVAARELVCFLPEAIVSLGVRVPLVPLATPGAAAVTALEPFLDGYDAVLVAGNGVWAWGEHVEQAYLRLELVEHLATIAAAAAPWGGPKALPADLVAQMVEARKKYFPRYAGKG